MATTVFNPSETHEDGMTIRSGVSENFATIIAANGTSFGGTGNDISAPQFGRSAPNYTAVRRAITQFDTSIIGSDVSSVGTLELYVDSKSDNMGGLSIVVVGCSPANANAVVAADYQTRLTTALSDVVSIASISTSSYNTWTLNAAGLAYINGAGATPLMIIMEEDRSGTDPAAGSAAGIVFATQEQGTNKPKLTVTYDPAPPVGSPIFYQ